MYKKERGVNPSDFRMDSLLIIEQNRKTLYRKEGEPGQRKWLQTNVPPTDSLLYRPDLTDDALKPLLLLWVSSICSNSGDAVNSGLLLALQCQPVPSGAACNLCHTSTPGDANCRRGLL